MGRQMTSDPDDPNHRQLAIKVADRLADADRDAVAGWLRGLLKLREADLPIIDKAAQALKLTAASNVVWPTAKLVAVEVKRLAWDDRGLPARMGLGAAALGVALLGGQSAGVAALGTAIGVPLWIVLGAGGAFAGVLIEELTKGSGTT